MIGPMVGVVSIGLPMGWIGAQEPSAGLGEHDHDHDTPAFDSRNYTPEEIARIDRLFGMIVCACPRESWTLSLSGCPRSCANGQKSEVRAAVKEGWSDERILEEQRDRHGVKAVGRASAAGLSGFLLYLGPILAFLAVLIVLVLRLRKLVRPLAWLASEGAAPSRESPREGELSEEDRRLGDQIDRELAEMD